MTPTFCKHLRSKKIYVPAQAHELATAAAPDQPIDLGHVWCNRTMAEVGPDDCQVAAHKCTCGRSCFEE